MSAPGAPELRLATVADLPRLRELIPASVRGLAPGYYTAQQIESSILHMFGPDSQLIADGTYFAIEVDGQLAACGGWSRRKTLFGGDQTKGVEDPLLDPRVDAARIRAFFVHPAFARRGLGSLLMRACMAAAQSAGFRRLALVATLPGVPLYETFGFAALERFDAPLADGTSLPVVAMEREVEEGDVL